MNEQNFTPSVSQNPRGSFLLFSIILVLVIGMISGGAVFYWQQSVLRQMKHAFQDQINTLQEQIESDTSSSHIPEFVTRILDDEYQILLKENSQDTTNTDVYFQNQKSWTEVFFLTIADVERHHYHNNELHNGNLYIIKRIGYDGYPDENWTDELWRYDLQKVGTQLYSAKGIDFRVAPNEEYIAIKTDRLYIIDQQGDVVRTYAIDDLGIGDNNGLDIGLIQWSEDSSRLWGELSFTLYWQAVYAVQTSSWQVDTFDVSTLDMSAEKSLNGNTGVLAYSNYPALFDEESAKIYDKSGATVDLKTFDLRTKEQKYIATSITKPFYPEWLDENTLEFNNPDREDRIQVSTN